MTASPRRLGAASGASPMRLTIDRRLTGSLRTEVDGLVRLGFRLQGIDGAHVEVHLRAVAPKVVWFLPCLRDQCRPNVDLDVDPEVGASAAAVPARLLSGFLTVWGDGGDDRRFAEVGVDGLLVARHVDRILEWSDDRCRRASQRWTAIARLVCQAEGSELRVRELVQRRRGDGPLWEQLAVEVEAAAQARDTSTTTHDLTVHEPVAWNWGFDDSVFD